MNTTLPARMRFTTLSSVAAALWLAAGCSSTPPTRFHSLQADAAASPSAAPAGLVDLGPIGIPPAVDQPQWVVRMADGSLRVLEQERWVGPLRDDLRAAVLDRLRAGNGFGDVRNAPPPAPPAWRVRLDVQRFDTVAGTGVALEARWTAVPPGATAGFACAAALQQHGGADALALAAAHRRAVAALADRIGASLNAGACPAP